MLQWISTFRCGFVSIYFPIKNKLVEVRLNNTWMPSGAHVLFHFRRAMHIITLNRKIAGIVHHGCRIVNSTLVARIEPMRPNMLENNA